MARDPDVGRRAGRGLKEPRQGFPIGSERAVLTKGGIEKGAGFGSRRRSAERGDRISVASKKDFHARRALSRGGGESAHAKLFFQREQHALDMLARPKTVDAMVDAAAGIGPAREIADLDIIETARVRAHTEYAIGAELRLQRLYIRNLRPAPPPAQLGLVRVAGLPAENLRLFQNLAGLGWFSHHGQTHGESREGARGRWRKASALARTDHRFAGDNRMSVRRRGLTRTIEKRFGSRSQIATSLRAEAGSAPRFAHRRRSMGARRRDRRRPRIQSGSASYTPINRLITPPAKPRRA